MARHIFRHGNPHGLLLTITQISIATWERLQQCLVDVRDFSRVDWNQFVLLIPMPDKDCLPTACTRAVGHRDSNPKETETTIAFRVNFTTSVQDKSLRDGGFHLGHSPSEVVRDVCGDAVTSMHDESAIVQKSA